MHINDPELVEVNSTGEVDHVLIAKALSNVQYNRYVSIEMRTMADYEKAVVESLRFTKETYVDAQLASV